MALESPVAFINDLVITNPIANDPRSEGDDHLRNIKVAVQACFPGLAGRSWRTQTKSANYTAVANDNMSLINCTTALTLALTAAATLGNGWMALVYANGVAVTIDPNASETVNGSTTLALPANTYGLLLCDGSNFRFLGELATTGSSLVLIQTQTPSGVAACDFTGLTSTYDRYILSTQALVPSVNNDRFALRVSSNNGSSWDTALNYASGGAIQSANVTRADDGNNYNVGYAFQSFVIGNNAGYGGYNSITDIFALCSAVPTGINTVGSGVHGSTGIPWIGVYGGTHAVSTAQNALRVMFNTGNITSGTVSLYGVRKS